MVYHLFTQLEALPNWVAMAAQRQGEMTEFGPLPVECVLTETELDWFTRALELACFFTPLAAERLRELNAARGARTVQQQPLPPPVAYAAAYDPMAAVLPLPPTSNYALPSRDPSTQLPPPPPPPQHQQTMELPIVSVAASLSSGMTADQYSLDQSTAAGGTWGVDSYQSALSASTSSDVTGSSDRNSLSPPGQGTFGSATLPNLTSGGEASYAMDASGSPLLGGTVEPVPPLPPPPPPQQQQPSLTMPWPDVGYDFQLPPQRTAAINTVSPESTVGIIAPPATMGAGSAESENGQPWQPTSSMPPPPPPPSDAGPDSWTNYNTNGWS